ncbi:adenylate/guanylate cyclase domain-containing protein [Sphingobacterium sp. UBA5980]|uniref:adenylate/guanylate cyclase domain-containing protein n=1 Tax=Sphingobacterium sp. UBA5980 TaxID=1947504 RepID=UPI00257FDC79|nr:adenylate/guanylate cyclase domain-containing protein [Sphingobacterium sp. UBA5980]
MAISEDIKNEIITLLNTQWSTREGTTIPSTDTVTLKNGSVKIDATFFYADLAGSSVIAQNCPWQTTAKIIRVYLNSATRLIKHYKGEIRSFDGDRVMGVFIGPAKNTNAVRCALALDWIVDEIIVPKTKFKFKSIRENNITIKHCVGIDTGECRAVRAGIRDNNDLIWIGRAPSFAAKLSDIRKSPNAIWITKKVYSAINDDVKYATMDNEKINMWTSDKHSFANQDEQVYKTAYHWKPK